MSLSRKRDFDAPLIPDRLYFKIGDVARICSVETYVLRFWESQFPQLKPNKSGTGQRLYRRRDVELALQIKKLVHVQGYTLAGARQVLEQAHRHTDSHPAPQLVLQPLPVPEAQPTPQPTLLQMAAPSGEAMDDVASTIAHARTELRAIASMLASPDPQPARRRARLATMPPPSGSLFPSI
jgi:DNA-binding transcriptional MerR regulator